MIPHGEFPQPQLISENGQGQHRGHPQLFNNPHTMELVRSQLNPHALRLLQGVMGQGFGNSTQPTDGAHPGNPQGISVTQPLQPQAIGVDHSFSPQQWALARLQQLRNMGVNTPGASSTMDPAALWRQMSPVMGSIIQARAGQQPTNDLSNFSPQIQALVASTLSQSQRQPMPHGNVGY